jgi:protein-disulfide isomerase
MTTSKGNAGVAIAIVVAGALIAGALYFALGAHTTGTTDTNANPDQLVQDNLRLPDGTDYVRGDVTAPILLIEYADLECPACKYYSPLVKEAFDHYKGEMAVVFRQFPLTSLHSKAPKEAEAAECAGELGGTDAYYKFIDRIYEVTPGNNGLDLATLPDIAAYAGVDKAAFTQCLDSGKYADKVQKSYDEAISLGAQGTPFTVLVVGDKRVPIGGSPNDVQTLISFVDSLRK